MTPIELFHKDGRSASVFVCGQCRTVAANKERATLCCARYCPDCGSPLDKGFSWIRCNPCRAKGDIRHEAERFEKAEKVTEWGGYVLCGGNYYPSLETMMDICDDEGLDIPAYVWTCDPVQFVKVDLDDITDRFADDAYEDWEPDTLDGLPELKAALEAFVEANNDQMAYQPNYKRALLIPKREVDAVELEGKE